MCKEAETSELINIEQLEIFHTSYSRNAKYLVYDKPRIETSVVLFTSTQKMQASVFQVKYTQGATGFILLKPKRQNYLAGCEWK